MTMKICAIVISVILLCSMATAQEYSIDRYVIASGGGHSESASYSVDGTIGQPITGSASSDNYGVEGGFWGGGGAPSGDCVYFPGDVNHTGTPLELSDVVAMIGNYRGSTEPSYTCDCPPHGAEFAATADPNGNCVPLELSDVVTEIGAYRGSTQASGCGDCPGSLRLLPGSDDPLMVMPRLKTKARIGDRRASE
jgi:hypothetical protein